MKQWWEGLKPPERRWAVFIGGIIFLMLNYFFILPYVGELKRNEFRIKRASDTNEVYSAESRHKNEYARKIREFQTDGSEVLPEDQAIDFYRFVNSCAVSNAIMITSQGNLVTHTNDYSLDQQMTVGAQASETNLVSFLYNLGTGNSMMRVRAMSLHPDPSHMQLGASITLVASYQKKAPPARGTTPAKVAVTAPPPPKPAPAIVKPPEHTPASPTMAATNKPSGPFARPIASTNKPGSPNANRP